MQWYRSVIDQIYEHLPETRMSRQDVTRHVARISPRGGGGAAPQKGPLPSVQRAPSDSPKGPFSLTRGPSDLHRGPLNVHGALWSFRQGPGGPKDL